MTTQYPRALTHEGSVQQYASCVADLHGVIANLREVIATLPAPGEETNDVIGIDYGTLETLLFVRSRLGEVNEMISEALD